MIPLSTAFAKSTVSEYLRYWLHSYCEKRLARNTIAGYRTNIENHIVPYIGDVLLFDLQPLQIEAMYEALEKGGLSSTSILYVHATLRKALNTAVKRRMLDCNAIDYLDAPIKSHFKPTVLNSDCVLRLLNECRKSYEIYIPVLLAVSLGLRRGEVLGLKWSDIDWNEKTIEIQRTATFYKGGVVLSEPKTKNSNRTLVMSNSLLKSLREWNNSQHISPQDFIVCRSTGDSMSSTVLNNLYQAALKRAGLPSIRFHDLRHTNATLMLKRNVPAKIVSSILGHSSVGITLDTYSHVLTDMQRPAVDAMEYLLIKQNPA